MVYPWEMIYCYNFSTDNGAELKFDRHEDLIVLNTLKHKYCVVSHVICHVTIYLHMLNIRQIGGGFKKRNQAITFFSFILHFSNTSRLN